MNVSELTKSLSADLLTIDMTSMSPADKAIVRLSAFVMEYVADEWPAQKRRQAQAMLQTNSHPKEAHHPAPPLKRKRGRPAKKTTAKTVG